MKELKARFHLVWQDVWVGAYWKKKKAHWSYWVDGPEGPEQRFQRCYLWEMWICLMPCVPLHLEWTTFPDKKDFEVYYGYYDK